MHHSSKGLCTTAPRMGYSNWQHLHQTSRDIDLSILLYLLFRVMTTQHSMRGFAGHMAEDAYPGLGMLSDFVANSSGPSQLPQWRK
jgi:hypothetical protein